MCRPCAEGDGRMAFTIVEMLVVMSIIALLATMILAVRGPLMESQRASRTRAILGIIQQGLALARTDKGSIPAPAEHPFAGSKAPRLRFRGQRGGSWIDLKPTGEAIAGVAEARLDLAGEADADERLLDAADVCNEPDLPAFYGLERRYMGIIGIAQANITRRLDLSNAPGSGMIPAGAKGYRPYSSWSFAGDAARDGYSSDDPPHYPALSTGNPSFPSDQHLVEGVARTRELIPVITIDKGAITPCASPMGPADQAAALAQQIPEALLEELRQLGAAFAPPDDAPERLVVPGPGVPACAEWDPDAKRRWLIGKEIVAGKLVVRRPYAASRPRVWSDGVGEPQWKPGRIRPALDGSGAWVTYRLRGLALYDAWGSELLYMANQDGSPTVLSAGRDRCFAIVPGLVDANGASVFATVLTAGTPAEPVSPDRDGHRDNISLDGLK